MNNGLRPAARPAAPRFARGPGRRPGARCKRRGAALVEFAVVAPFFVMLVVASAEMNACIQEVHRLSAALREAGRLSSMDWDESLPGSQTPGEKIEEDVKNFLAAGGTPREDVEFSMSHAEGDSAGEPFALGNSANRLELFTMEASLPTPGGAFAQVWFGDRLRVRFTFRAGRDSHEL
ncbi:TadE/TadG family type IV pilus assembly protein [Alienimonas californiensis]|uniref:TadE-like domain-containing protein n=1 Tax=Alienimonas californiensis TaxID=2527989 RepID=A0A517P7R9_9PLAN|nr:TadE/TadG family type IV pilus assembly protein [Alienimonas californiensis]QDT15421.1 hypothetical protein CA12_15060 [Alienimonas californiensis]